MQITKEATRRSKVSISAPLKEFASITMSLRAFPDRQAHAVKCLDGVMERTIVGPPDRSAVTGRTAGERDSHLR